MSKILLIHGPNLNLLGQREPEVYGKVTIEEINQDVKKEADAEGINVEIMQSNHEGEIVDIIGKAKDRFEGIIINPAAYTHTSIAIRDAISAAGIPAIEVHLSNIYSREEFRHTSLVAPVALGQISGFGKYSYILAIKAIAKILNK